MLYKGLVNPEKNRDIIWFLTSSIVFYVDFEYLIKNTHLGLE